MLNSEPLFSIIIPAYNAEKTIERSINSVLKQKVKEWELIIVENGSTDNTNDVVKKYLMNSNIILLHSQKGVSRARNYGIHNARGKWILFLDADDELSDGALLSFFNAVNEYPYNYVYVGLYGDMKANHNVFEISTEEFLCISLNDPTKFCNATAVLINRFYIIQNNLSFDEELTHAEDSLFFLEVCIYLKSIVILNECVYKVFYNVQSAVRNAQYNLFENYKNAILKIQKLNFNPFVNKEINSFILNQVLIVLVNNTYAVKLINFSNALKIEKIIMNDKIVKEAIEDVKFDFCDKKRKVIFLLMKHKAYLTLGLICFLKNKINLKKASCNI